MNKAIKLRVYAKNNEELMKKSIWVQEEETYALKFDINSPAKYTLYSADELISSVMFNYNDYFSNEYVNFKVKRLVEWVNNLYNQADEKNKKDGRLILVSEKSGWYDGIFEFKFYYKRGLWDHKLRLCDDIIILKDRYIKNIIMNFTFKELKTQKQEDTKILYEMLHDVIDKESDDIFNDSFNEVLKMSAGEFRKIKFGVKYVI